MRSIKYREFYHKIVYSEWRHIRIEYFYLNHWVALRFKSYSWWYIVDSFSMWIDWLWCRKPVYGPQWVVWHSLKNLYILKKQQGSHSWYLTIFPSLPNSLVAVKGHCPIPTSFLYICHILFNLNMHEIFPAGRPAIDQILFKWNKTPESGYIDNQVVSCFNDA